MISKLHFILNTLFLTYASYLDIKTREITDKIWLIMLIVNIPFTIYFILNISNTLRTIYIVNSIISITLFLLLAYFGFMGGADAKALIILQLSEINSILPSSLLIYINGILLSLLVVPYILYRNLQYYLRHRYLFRKKIPLYKKILMIISSYKMKYSEKIGKNKYFYTFLGKDEKTIRLKMRIDESDFKIDSKIGEGEEIWISPTIPLILFITVGYIVYKIWGNIIFKLFLLL